MEVSALKYSGGLGLHGRPSLLRLQSDERLIVYIRKGNQGAFEVLLSRYETRLLAFCRHLLGSREDAEDVMQEVMTAAFNAILADERPINVRPWLYRIARNRSLNHLRRARAIASDEMDAHLSEHGATTADKAHEREEFRLLVGDIHELPESQKTALVLREMDAMSYEQIAEAMETTVPSVKSLLVRARVSLAEAAEARLLSCDEVRIELGEIAEGLRRRPSPLVRRHLRSCDRCSVFRSQLRQTNKALAALLPIGPFMVLKKFAFVHLHHTAGASAASHAAGAGAGAHAAGAGAGAAGAGMAVSGAAVGSSMTAGGGILSAGLGALAGKAAVGLAAAAIVTAGAVEADHAATHHPHHHAATVAAVTPAAPAAQASPTPVATAAQPRSSIVLPHAHRAAAATTKTTRTQTTTVAATTPTTSTSSTTTTTASTPTNTPTTPDGRGQTQTDPTVLPTPLTPTDPGTGTAPPSASPTPAGSPTTSGSPTTAGSPTTSASPTTTSGTPTTTSGSTPTDPSSTSPTTTATPLPPITVTTPTPTPPSNPSSGEGSAPSLTASGGAPGR